MTPPAILQLVNHRRVREVDLTSLINTGSGAAHLPPKLAKTWKGLLKNVDSISEGVYIPSLLLFLIQLDRRHLLHGVYVLTVLSSSGYGMSECVCPSFLPS